MPYGGTTPEQDKKIERCVTGLMAKGKEKSSAIAICKSSIMKGESVEDIVKREIGENAKSCDFTESLTFSIQEGSINEEKRTVRVCALAPCISANNRFYSPKVVESVVGTLIGKKSFADHDQRDTKNLIGRIANEDYKNGKLYADIKFSKSTGIAKETFEKIQDGTITDVSIAADGKMKKVKLGEKTVDEVTELKIHSVDFVTEGGIQDAKVMRVFENLSEIPQISEVKEEMTKEEMEAMRNTKMDACMKGMMAKGKPEDMAKKTCSAMVNGDKQEDFSSIVDMFEQPLKDKITDLETKITAKEVGEYKEAEIAKLQVKEEVKALLRERVNGKTKEEVTASVKAEIELVEKVAKATKGEAKIDGVPPNHKKDDVKFPDGWTGQRVKEDAKIPEGLKVQCAKILVLEGSKKMFEFLKTYKIELV